MRTPPPPFRPSNKNILLKITPATTDFRYNGHEIVVPNVSVIVGVDCSLKP